MPQSMIFISWGWSQKQSFKAAFIEYVKNFHCNDLVFVKLHANTRQNIGLRSAFSCTDVLRTMYHTTAVMRVRSI
jgi:hypothetical protein